MAAVSHRQSIGVDRVLQAGDRRSSRSALCTLGPTSDGLLRYLSFSIDLWTVLTSQSSSLFLFCFFIPCLRMIVLAR